MQSLNTRTRSSNVCGDPPLRGSRGTQRTARPHRSAAGSLGRISTRVVDKSPKRWGEKQNAALDFKKAGPNLGRSDSGRRLLIQDYQVRVPVAATSRPLLTQDGFLGAKMDAAHPKEFPLIELIFKDKRTKTVLLLLRIQICQNKLSFFFLLCVRLAI